MAQVSAELAASSSKDVRDGTTPDFPAHVLERQRREHQWFARRLAPWWTSLAAALRREPEALRFYVVAGEVASTGPWLYAWVHLPSGRVVHAGTTPLDPRVRAWAHLDDPDPERGRVGALLRSPAAQGELDDLDAFEVSAVRLPDGAARPPAKRALLDALLAADLLSEELAQRAATEAAARSSSSDPVEPLDAGTRRSIEVLVRELRRSRWR
ncbi:hypothetical protein ACUN7V_04720 [Quadrisphaera oryzae]|uniref:hypothetical protein n=1 Tax=Quadrisphaera TaxID=317661 RepID=UPI0016478BCA|nr:hypothetical protein [Quadrisphaera sp. RL12-1S]MBC3762431.1 hypothetical protein [Quadrisphaera sp. RL12-1S]